MTEMSEYQITEAMFSFGGKFVKQFAQLYRVADDANQRRLLDAFPELWNQYRDIAERAAERAAAKV